jgi:hypothetical protein
VTCKDKGCDFGKSTGRITTNTYLSQLYNAVPFTYFMLLSQNLFQYTEEDYNSVHSGRSEPGQNLNLRICSYEVETLATTPQGLVSLRTGG